jgi:AcrR family transcriptional regulator
MSPSFIQDARRSQLTAVTIEVLAEVGAEQASLVRIAERAGVSRGVVNYHFGSRRELFEAVVAEVYAVGEREVLPAVAEAADPREALEAFTRGSIAFYARFPAHLAALTAIYTSRTEDSLAREERAEHATEMANLAGRLREGQVSGQLRDFDVTLMSLTIRAVLDTSVGLLRAGAEPDALAGELWRTIDAATRAEGAA